MNNSFLKITLLSIFYVISTLTTAYLLDIDKLIYSTLSETLSFEQVKKYIEIKQKWQWISILIIPLFLLLKTTTIATALYIGTFLFSKITMTFKQLWTTVVTAEFLFLFIGLVKIVWFYFFQTNYTLEDIQYFYPLSALNIVGYEGLEPWLIYPFQVLNLFELAYWLVLAYYIGKATETTMDHGLKIVMSSYGSALLLWVVVVMFFTLNYS